MTIPAPIGYEATSAENELKSTPTIGLPVVLAFGMLVFGLIAARAAGLNPNGLFLPYMVTGMGVTAFALLISAFAWVIGLAKVGADRPLQLIRRRIQERWTLLLLPTLVFPLFFVGYTAAKAAIPSIVGYTWDVFWSEADRLLFGNDAWRLAQRLLSGVPTAPLEFVYTMLWAGMLLFGTAFVAINASRQKVVHFYSALFLSWLLAGALLAYGLSAAGPVFAGYFDPRFVNESREIRSLLGHSLNHSGPVMVTQQFLAAAVRSPMIYEGSGISAMPSMHVAIVTIYVCAARRTCWQWPALIYWAAIFFLSAYFGYHYWIDGIAATAVAVGCWYASELLLRIKALPIAGLRHEAASSRDPARFVHAGDQN